MEPIYYLGIVQALFAALLVLRKPNKSIADRLLAIWLMVIGLEMFYSLLNYSYYTWLPDLIIIPLTYGPFLYFYTKLLTSRNPVFPRALALHLLPVLVFILVALLWGEPIDIDSVDFLQKGSITTLSIINFAVFFVSMIYYWWIAFVLIKKHNHTLSDHFSYRSDAIKLTWLKTIAIWIFAGFILTGLVFFVFSVESIFPFNPIDIFHFGLLIFTFSISFYGIHQPVLYKQVSQRPKTTLTVDPIAPSEGLVDIGDRLKALMCSEKPYLNNELTIQHLADKLDVTPAVISAYLNKNLGMNFFNYVNGFRIEEAKLRLSNPAYANDTLLCIAFDSGFNSKSSFNTLFKKSTGITPSEYRKIHSKG